MNKKRLNREEIEFITKRLKEGKALPDSYRYVIPFETKKEYELTYADKKREEDILSDSMRVPLQPVKTFSNHEENDKKLLSELLKDETLPRYALQKVENTFNFKTPLNLVFASYKPERNFIKKLVKEENAKVVDSWIKSPDIGFYSVEYSWRKGEHPKQGSFNPDFFIKIGNDILVIEIKSDDDLCDENKAKLKYAKEHFERLNNLRQKQNYYFKFLSPKSYDSFFQYLRKGKYQEFVSEIEAKLEGKS